MSRIALYKYIVLTYLHALILPYMGLANYFVYCKKIFFFTMMLDTKALALNLSYIQYIRSN